MTDRLTEKAAAFEALNLCVERLESDGYGYIKGLIRERRTLNATKALLQELFNSNTASSGGRCELQETNVRVFLSAYLVVGFPSFVFAEDDVHTLPYKNKELVLTAAAARFLTLFENAWRSKESGGAELMDAAHKYVTAFEDWKAMDVERLRKRLVASLTSMQDVCDFSLMDTVQMMEDEATMMTDAKKQERLSTAVEAHKLVHDIRGRLEIIGCADTLAEFDQHRRVGVCVSEAGYISIKPQPAGPALQPVSPRTTIKVPGLRERIGEALLHEMMVAPHAEAYTKLTIEEADYSCRTVSDEEVRDFLIQRLEPLCCSKKEVKPAVTFAVIACALKTVAGYMPSAKYAMACSQAGEAGQHLICDGTFDEEALRWLREYVRPFITIDESVTTVEAGFVQVVRWIDGLRPQLISLRLKAIQDVLRAHGDDFERLRYTERVEDDRIRAVCAADSTTRLAMRWVLREFGTEFRVRVRNADAGARKQAHAGLMVYALFALDEMRLMDVPEVFFLDYAAIMELRGMLAGNREAITRMLVFEEDDGHYDNANTRAIVEQARPRVAHSWRIYRMWVDTVAGEESWRSGE